MKKIIPFIALAVIATSIYSCQKEQSAKPKATINALSAKGKKDTVPPAATFKVIKDTVPPAAKFTTASKDTVPPSK
ncbi:hypothetical protein [Mucilaginibacter pedocola]|uniref:Uncharacterized protein n=1 Tax=Mucilaginibacter pedocola TaxID=1792845 RepID=A0A1S9PDE7_9SPHI|nr:hypothetical protein [Mucilaginibacter pedocola]OOQ58991.1 hypothetical protein BC343_29970 [Mucilaginibacter pedocola]